MSQAQSRWLDLLADADAVTRWTFSTIKPAVKGRVLEIGCGTGNYSALLAALADELTLCDLEAAFLEKARERLAHLSNVRVIVADAARDDLGGPYDTIVLMDVLEHIEDDAALLKRMRAALAPDGTLILKVPAMNWLYNSLDRAVGHHRRYRVRSLEEQLNRAGLGLAHCRHFNASAIPGWWVNGNLLRRHNPPAGQLRLFNRLVPALAWVEDRLQLPLGLALIAYAKPQ